MSRKVAPDDATVPPPQPTRGKLNSLYYFATPLDQALILVGCICKAGCGFIQTYILIIFGEFFDMSSGRSWTEMGMQMFIGMPEWSLNPRPASICC